MLKRWEIHSCVIWISHGLFSQWPLKGKNWPKKRSLGSIKIRLNMVHMGHFPQDGENEQNLSFFSFFEASLWPNGSQLFWRDYVRCSLKILSFTLQKIFGVPCSTPVFALLSDFWVKIRALVSNHCKNCECCPVSLLIVSSPRLSWIQVFNCQKCNQCLKCHKSPGLSL